MQVAVIEEHHEALGKALALDTELAVIRGTLHTYLENGDNLCRSLEDIRKLHSICIAIVESKNLQDIKKQFGDYIDRLNFMSQNPNAIQFSPKPSNCKIQEI